MHALLKTLNTRVAKRAGALVCACALTAAVPTPAGAQESPVADAGYNDPLLSPAGSARMAECAQGPAGSTTALVLVPAGLALVAGAVTVTGVTGQARDMITQAVGELPVNDQQLRQVAAGVGVAAFFASTFGAQLAYDACRSQGNFGS